MNCEDDPPFLLGETEGGAEFDLVISNPPFGRKKEWRVLGCSPEKLQAGDTALLFLQQIMQRLKSPRRGFQDESRAAVVVPESVLSEGGIAARVRQELIESFNLHTIVRLPKGVFGSYTDIKTNILFFDRSGPTRETWFWQQDLPLERRALKNPRYTQTYPLCSHELQAIADWWDDRSINEYAWKIGLPQIKEAAYSLDFRNPRRLEISHGSPLDVVQAITELLGAEDMRIKSLEYEIRKVEQLLSDKPTRQRLGTLLTRSKVICDVDDEKTYKQITVRLHGKGVTLRKKLLGKYIKTRPQFLAKQGQLIMSRIDARNGAFGLVPLELDEALVTRDFPLYDLDVGKVDPVFLLTLFRSERFIEACKSASWGSTSRERIKEELFLEEVVPVPDLEAQKLIAGAIIDFNRVIDDVASAENEAGSVTTMLANFMFH